MTVSDLFRVRFPRDCVNVLSNTVFQHALPGHACTNNPTFYPNHVKSESDQLVGKIPCLYIW